MSQREISVEQRARLEEYAKEFGMNVDDFLSIGIKPERIIAHLDGLEEEIKADLDVLLKLDDDDADDATVFMPLD